MTPEQITELFTYHRPTGDQPARYEKINAACLAAAIVINETCPESAEKTLAIRDLQRARMMANCSIAVNES